MTVNKSLTAPDGPGRGERSSSSAVPTPVRRKLGTANTAIMKPDSTRDLADARGEGGGREAGTRQAGRQGKPRLCSGTYVLPR